MKKEKKVKEKRESIKLNKLNKRINLAIGIIALFYILNNIILYFSNDYAYFFTAHIVNNINGIFYYLNSNINYFSFILFGLYFITLIIYFVLDIYYEGISKKPFEYRQNIVNKFYTIFILFSIIIILPSYISQFSNHLPNFDELYFQETKNKTYTKEDLIELDKYLQEKVLSISDSIKRDDKNEIDINVDYNKQAVNDLLNVSNEIKLLKGLYPRKSSKINNLIRGMLGSKVVGFTTPYNTYFDYDASKTSVMNTITHEFCHTKGILRENETVYCAFLAGSKSDSELSNYSAYIEAFSWVSEALMRIDAETSDYLEDEVLSRCLTNDYKELCEAYTKNNTEYVLGSKIIRISSYRLKNYFNHQKELEESLTILKNNNFKIYVDKEEKSISEVIELVNDKSESRISIESEISESIFNNIKDAIKDKRLYLSIYQKNKEDKESTSKLNDPVKYYLGPFKDKDENIIFNGSYSSVEYEYSRVARLLLEHYEKEGFQF